MSEPTDAERIEAYLAGAPGAREALLDRWLPVVLQWCARLGGSDVDPEDAAQDVFVVVLTGVEALRDRTRFQSWLFGITRRTVLRHRRRAWFRRWVPFVPVDRPSDASPQRKVELDETTRRVQAVLDALPAAQREVLVLCELEERSNVEAAALLEVPVGTVKSRLRIARERFRRLAREQDLGPVPCGEGR